MFFLVICHFFITFANEDKAQKTRKTKIIIKDLCEPILNINVHKEKILK
jgi:hypothetical protein